MIPPDRDPDCKVARFNFTHHHRKSQVQQKGEAGSLPDIGDVLEKL